MSFPRAATFAIMKISVRRKIFPGGFTKFQQISKSCRHRVITVLASTILSTYETVLFQSPYQSICIYLMSMDGAE